MLASHDVFSHTGPPIAKIKRGVWFVLLPARPVSNWRDHPLPYSYWGLVFACCFVVCLLLECLCWFTLLAVVCRGKNEILFPQGVFRRNDEEAAQNFTIAMNTVIDLKGSLLFNTV